MNVQERKIITKEKVSRTILLIKNGKAGGTDRVVKEMVKSGCKIAVE